MFEPEYTNAMASVLEMIDKYGSFVLPEEEISDKMSEFLKRERSKSEEVMDSSDIDVCTSRKTCITPCFTYEDTDTYEGEGETERTISEQIYDKEDWRSSDEPDSSSRRIWTLGRIAWQLINLHAVRQWRYLTAIVTRSSCNLLSSAY